MNKKQLEKEIMLREKGKSILKRCDLLEIMAIMADLENEFSGDVSKIIQSYAKRRAKK